MHLSDKRIAELEGQYDNLEVRAMASEIAMYRLMARDFLDAIDKEEEKPKDIVRDVFGAFVDMITMVDK